MKSNNEKKEIMISNEETAANGNNVENEEIICNRRKYEAMANISIRK